MQGLKPAAVILSAAPSQRGVSSQSIAMAAPGPLLLSCVLSLAVNIGYGGYLITTPQKWTVNALSQVCIHVTNAAAPAGTLLLSVTLPDQLASTSQSKPILPSTSFQVPAGKVQTCFEVRVQDATDDGGTLHVSGAVGGAEINHNASIEFNTRTQTIFIQTDKYLYQPGQNVKFRVLTVAGYDVRVSTEQYPEVWVTTPSRTRIAQWKNVDNSAGLVHLDFDLADEPEKGKYRIHVRPREGATASTEFKVEDFVLPRFEVNITPRGLMLTTDEKYTFTVCAKYTYGQPVKGDLTFIVKSRSGYWKGNVTKELTISGCGDIQVRNWEFQNVTGTVKVFKATAIVREEGTDVEIKGERYFSISRNTVTFKTLYSDTYLKLYLPFTLKLRAELPDGSPVADARVKVCARQCIKKTTGADGIITMVLPSFSTLGVNVRFLNGQDTRTWYVYDKTLTHYFSPSNSSLLINGPEAKVKCGSGEAKELILPVFFCATNQSSAYITVQVVSRGKIQYSNTKEYKLISSDLPISEEHLVEPLPPPPPESIVRGVINVKVRLPPTASPRVKVLVWYTREDGEVVSDARELEVEKCLSSSVSLIWSKSQAQPGEQVSLSLTSEPDSVCSLDVVDRSTELLAEKTDSITLEKVFDLVDYFTKEKGDPRFGFFNSIYVPAHRMFHDAGLHVFTDLTLDTFSYLEFSPHPIFSKKAALIVPRSSPGGSSSQSAATNNLRANGSFGGEVVSPPRTNFPETWLWDLVVTPSSGLKKQELTLPDTITQWVGKAVCVHPKEGLGLSKRQTIVTFTPFFVDLTVPPTVKRGEVLPVKISVFNYLGQPIPVTVTVGESPEYEILEDPATEGQDGKRHSCVPAQDKVVHTVKVRPMATGDVNITVVALADHQHPGACGSGDTSIRKRDALIKPIRVETEGILREKTWTKYICSRDLKTGDDSLETWQLETPTPIIEGSVRGWVTAVGSLLALSLENLGHLIRLPYGCGEQNMVNFAPNIFIMQYLTASKQTTRDSTKKLLTFMRKGYQRELLYRRKDGSYSVFGKNDDSGSTWLTAFVLKSFAQAQHYIAVDETVLESASSWLQMQQRNDGCFSSVGKVLLKSLKGGITGSDSPVPLTAYVMISLLEAGEDPASTHVSAAARCLKADSSQDPYTLALKAYALTLGRLPEGEEVLQQLLDQAIVTRNSTHWELPKGPGKSKSVEVETAGYAIMAMITLDPKGFEQQARKVMKWITTQRNGQGGFYSTQDTVVALQAIALYESHLYQGPLNVVATVTATGLTHSFTITDDNKLLQQLVTLPTLPTNVIINMEGQGCAVIQAVLRYNIPEPEQNKAFSLTVKTNTVPDSRCVTKRITACAAYRLPDGESNMALIQVDLISGYIPEKEDLKKLVRDNANIKRYEVDGSLVTFYMEELTDQESCVDFRAIREVDVEDVKAGVVTVYDYYQPEQVVSKRYTLPPTTECL